MSFLLALLLVPLITARSLLISRTFSNESDTDNLLRSNHATRFTDFHGAYSNVSLERRQYERHLAAITNRSPRNSQPWAPTFDVSLDIPNGNARSVDESNVNTRRNTSLIARGTESIEECMRDLGVTSFWVRDDEKYRSYMNHAYNPSYTGNPQGIVIASTTADVKQAVLCAAKAGIPVQPSAGGHSWADYSSGYSAGEKDPIIIDLKQMNKIEYDEDDHSVTVGGGVLLGNLALALLDEGRAISHGDCPSVGIAGHALHGGIGPTSRMWGVSTDFITGLTVVTADGQVQQASETENSDLFYAMRGAGSSFGVAVNLKLKTVPAPEQVTSINFYGALTDPNTVARSFVKIQSCVQSDEFDQHLALNIMVERQNQSPSEHLLALGLRGYYFGAESQVEDVIEPCFLQAMEAETDIEAIDYDDYLWEKAGGASVEEPEGGYGTWAADDITMSIALPEDSPPSQVTMERFFSALADSPEDVQANFHLIGGTGSRVPLNADSTPLPWRSGLWGLSLFTKAQGLGKDVETVYKTVVDTANERNNYGLTTFIDGDLDRAQAHKTYYNPSQLTKLEDIKAKYDAGNVFSNPQSIKPAGKVELESKLDRLTVQEQDEADETARTEAEEDTGTV